MLRVVKRLMMLLMVRQAAGSRGEDCGGLVEACLCVQKFQELDYITLQCLRLPDTTYKNHIS